MVAVSCQSDCCVTNIMNLKKTNSLCRSYSSFCRLSVSLYSVVPDHYLKHFCLFFFFFFCPFRSHLFFFSLPPNEQTDRSPEEVGLGHCLVSLCHRWRICCHVKWRGGVAKKREKTVINRMWWCQTGSQCSQECAEIIAAMLCRLVSNTSLQHFTQQFSMDNASNHTLFLYLSNIKNDQVKIGKYS